MERSWWLMFLSDFQLKTQFWKLPEKSFLGFSKHLYSIVSKLLPSIEILNHPFQFPARNLSIYIHTSIQIFHVDILPVTSCRFAALRQLETLKKPWVFCWFLVGYNLSRSCWGLQNSAPPPSQKILFSLIKPSKGVRFMGRYTPPSNWDPTGICKKKSIQNGKKNHPQNRIVREKHHIFLLHDGSEIPNNQLGWVLKPCKEWEKTNSKPQLISQISPINTTNLSSEQPFWFGQGTALLSRPIWNLIVYLKKAVKFELPLDGLFLVVFAPITTFDREKRWHQPSRRARTIKSWLVGGWTNPSAKYARQNGFIFPPFFRGENKKYVSCHHLVEDLFQCLLFLVVEHLFRFLLDVDGCCTVCSSS